MKRTDFLKFIASFDLSVKKLHKLFDFYSQENIEFDIVKQEKFIEIVGKENISKIQINANTLYLDRFLDKLYENQIQILSFEDKNYPEKLKRIDDPPYFLFYKGDVSLLNKKSLAIIGSRTPSNYGRVVTERFSKEVAESGLVVVSGLAYGVDSIAHRKALELNQKTIAVLGGGFDKIYPSQHTDLASEIARKGLIISEYSPSVLPTKYTFPQRNRIVAGISDGILITEAGAKSGTIITKDLALDYGIPIFAVPGNITSEKSEGTNNIIAHGQGQCVLSASDILEELGINQISNKKVYQLTFEEQMIYDLLCQGENNPDVICEKTGLNVNKLNSLLVSLEIRDIVKKMPGGFYSLS